MNPQLLGETVQNLVVPMTWCP